MLNRQLIDLIEQIGFITKDGVHVKGAAAVSCYTYTTIDDLNRYEIDRGHAILKSLLKRRFM